jgi:DNA (cytosine-5)-methyltransferase 1
VNVGSLFSGAGLLDLGLAQAGHRHGWFVERDEHRRAILGRRFPGVPVHDDVRTVGAHNLGAVDCIAGGFPCKGASSAGKRTGLSHPETALWAEFERIVREIQPRWVVVENVSAILTIHGGDVWRTVLGDLASLRYNVVWDCVPAAAVGAPHGRDRVFAFAAHADGAHAERHAGQRGFANGWPDARGGAQVTAVEWGEYEPAIRRWEHIHGPAPEPLVRRMDDGSPGVRRVRARLDRHRLSALGDGVHVHVARLVGEALAMIEGGD